MSGRRILTIVPALALLGAAGLVAAQTAAPTPIQPPPLQAPPVTAAPAAPPEEAPPVVVAPPAPVVAPPIDAREVAPAAPPKGTVAKPTETVLRRARYDVAVIQALDKVSARSVRFEAAVGKPVRYKSLVFTVRACERSTDDEAQEDSMVYITVQSQPRPAPGKPTPPPRQAFRGWMYASSPGLNPLQHPIYDAWLITCRAASPAIATR